MQIFEEPSIANRKTRTATIAMLRPINRETCIIAEKMVKRTYLKGEGTD